MSIKYWTLPLKINDDIPLLNFKLTFMGTLQDQVKISELNSDFSNKIFVSCLKLLQTYSPSVFFKDRLKLYVFESQKFISKL